ncbi:C-X-C chemokine receptor type 4 isoform X1 [Oryzias melastigma]|uniref:C-X-C chemokine receptor type 4 isoform X1 n=1 Tax=Oryzias melastigma TaxID=30732 RepID=UPI00168CCAC8|nr:C-X-C chemokine receptor type 4 isoform X1 [Oryzias melastigma]
MSYYEHFVLDYDSNDTGSGSGLGSGEVGVDLEEPCGMEHLMTAELQQVFLPVVYSLIFILGITGNGLVVLVLGCQRRSKCSLTDRYRLHLSAADLLFVLALPFWAVDAALADWRFGAATCVGVHVIYTVNLYGSVLILAFISLDRYLAVVRATDTNSGGLRQLLAHRLVYVGEELHTFVFLLLCRSSFFNSFLCAGAWMPAGLLAVPDLIFARTQEGGEGSTLCQRFYPDDNAPLWVAVFHLQLVLVGLVIPGLVLLVCYCVIVTRLTRGPLGGQRQKRRAVRTTIALVLCFFICWLPYGAGISVDALLRLEVLPRSCRLEAALGVWLSVAEPMAFAHCCLNPLLYAFLGAGFKSSARRALTLSRASSLKVLPRRRPGASTTTESESSSLHSS